MFLYVASPAVFVSPACVLHRLGDDYRIKLIPWYNGHFLDLLNTSSCWPVNGKHGGAGSKRGGDSVLEIIDM